MAPKLTAQQRRYLRKHGAPASSDPSEVDGELNIVPFLDIVVNLIMFLLMVTSSIAFYAQVDASLPSHDPPRGPGPEPALNLNVTLAATGIYVSGAGAMLAPGCDGGDPGGVTVPRRPDGEHDFAALTACVAQVKARHDDESRVTVGAESMEPYRDLVAAMDALRSNALLSDEPRPLFPEVLLAAGVR